MIHIHKSKPLSDFSIVPNAVSQNRELTLEARGMLVYLLSLPPTWEIRVEQVKAEVKVGTRVIRRIFQELEAAGHMWLQTLAGESGSFRGKRWHAYRSENAAV